MIEVDINELEQLADLVRDIASEAEELYSRLDMLKAEMSQDAMLATYPQYAPLQEMLGTITDGVSRVSDTLLTLRTVFDGAAEEYKEQEDRLAREFDGILSAISTLGASLAAAGTISVKPVEIDVETKTTDALQQMVASANDEMQVTNIAAVSMTIEEEYSVTGSESRLRQELDDAAEDTALAAEAAQGLRIEEDDGDTNVKKAFFAEVSENAEDLQSAVDAAEKIRTGFEG